MKDRPEKPRRRVTHFTVRRIVIGKEKAAARLQIAIEVSDGLQQRPAKIKLPNPGTMLASLLGDVIDSAGIEFEDATYLSADDFDNLFKEKAK